MTRLHEPIAEIDLLAYADGLLDGDVGRKEEVERYLSAHPEAADYVAEIREQNREIQAHFGPLLAEPVPERLSAVLRAGPPPLRHRMAARAAVVALLLLTSSVGGWLIGQRDQPDEWGVDEFVERAAAFHQTGVTDGNASPVVASDNMLQPLGWLNRRIALELAAPNLSTGGFELIAKERLGPSKDPMMRLVYKRPDGTTINLFLRPRWENHATRMSSAEAEDVTVLYWLDGPLAFAMTTDAPGPETDRLARLVRQAVGRARLSDDAPAMALSPGSDDPAEQMGGDRGLKPAPDTVPGQPQLQVN